MFGKDIISRDEIRKIIEENKANTKKLESCQLHEFGEILFSSLTPFPITKTKLVCKKCGGSLPLGAIIHYAEGYKAAGKNPDDIIKLIDNRIGGQSE